MNYFQLSDSSVRNKTRLFFTTGHSLFESDPFLSAISRPNNVSSLSLIPVSPSSSNGAPLQRWAFQTYRGFLILFPKRKDSSSLVSIYLTHTSRPLRKGAPTRQESSLTTVPTDTPSLTHTPGPLPLFEPDTN